MSFYDDLVFFFLFLGELDFGAKPTLLPEDGGAASEADVRKEQIMAHEDFLCLDEVGGVEAVVDAAAVEAGIEGIGTVAFRPQDVQRSRLVQRIVEAYGEDDAEA